MASSSSSSMQRNVSLRVKVKWRQQKCWSAFQTAFVWHLGKEMLKRRKLSFRSEHDGGFRRCFCRAIWPSSGLLQQSFMQFQANWLKAKLDTKKSSNYFTGSSGISSRMIPGHCNFMPKVNKTRPYHSFPHSFPTIRDLIYAGSGRLFISKNGRRGSISFLSRPRWQIGMTKRRRRRRRCCWRKG